MRADSILETCLYVTDLESAKHFYSTVLGLELFSEAHGRHVFFRCGNAMLLLFNPDATERQTIPGIGTHGSRGEGHVAFRMTEAQIPDWRQQLARNDVLIESEYTWPSGGYSLYFRDPAGNSVELATPKTWGL